MHYPERTVSVDLKLQVAAGNLPSGGNPEGTRGEIMRGEWSLVRKHVKGCPKVRCSCPWAVRFRQSDVNRSKSFSTKTLALDFMAQRLRDKRSGEETFPSKSQGAVKFTDYTESWIEGHSNQGTKSWMRTTLRRHVAPVVGNMTLAQVANDRELAQRLITSSTLSYQRKITMVIVSPVTRQSRAGGYRLTDCSG